MILELTKDDIEAIAEAVVKKLKESGEMPELHTKDKRLTQRKVTRLYGQRWLENAKKRGLTGQRIGTRTIYYQISDLEKYAEMYPTRKRPMPERPFKPIRADNKKKSAH